MGAWARLVEAAGAGAGAGGGVTAAGATGLPVEFVEGSAGVCPMDGTASASKKALAASSGLGLFHALLPKLKNEFIVEGIAGYFSSSGIFFDEDKL